MSQSETGRVSDEKLFKLCQDFDEHVERFNQHEKREIEARRLNTEAITELTKSVTELTRDTRDIVKTYKDLQGAARIGSSFQHFMIWLLKWGAIGAGVVAVIKWGVEHFK